jgi:membrane dipeptidase
MRLGTTLAAGLCAIALLAAAGSALGEKGRRGKKHAPKRDAGPEPTATAMVVDLHVDVPWQVHWKGRAPTLPEGDARISALTAGGVGGLVFPIYLPDKAHDDGAHIDDAEATYATIQRIVAASPIFLPLGSTQAEPGRITSFLSIEGAGAFAADPSAIDRFIARGVRLVSPAHASNTAFASSATGEPVDFGLTPLGKEFCARIYEHGALVDVSHVSDRAFDDIAALARAHGAPVVATHSNARALAKHPRNLTDAELRVIGETGGVAGLNFHAPFVVTGGHATIDDVVKQALHMVKVAGVDHVALGSDFDGGIRPAAGLEDASRYPRLADALVRAGLTPDDVAKIFSTNALRVLGWRAPQASP